MKRSYIDNQGLSLLCTNSSNNHTKETWSMKEKDNRKLSQFEHNHLMTIVGASYINHIKMNDIRSDLGILNKIRHRKEKIEAIRLHSMQKQCQICDPFIQELLYQQKTQRTQPSK